MSRSFLKKKYLIDSTLNRYISIAPPKAHKKLLGKDILKSDTDMQ